MQVRRIEEAIDEVRVYFRFSHYRFCWSQLMRQKARTSGRDGPDDPGRQD